MAIGEYNLQVPVGTYNVTASKEGHNPQTVKDVDVFEDQTTIVNIPLGGENMEHIVDVNITSCEDETIEVPEGCAQKRYKFAGAISGNPYVGKTVVLLSADGSIVLQTATTDDEGFATFANPIYGTHKLKIIY